MSGKEAALLSTLVRRLGKTDRLVLMLHYTDDLTAGEISQVLKLPESVVTATIERLQRWARSVLGPQEVVAAGADAASRGQAHSRCSVLSAMLFVRRTLQME